MALLTVKIMCLAARDPPPTARRYPTVGTKRRTLHNVENIRQHGVLQPILVRPLPEGEAGKYELVAGARRFRASKIAKRESIPANVRELTDAQALGLQVIENVQRVDVHPLDEAQGCEQANGKGEMARPQDHFVVHWRRSRRKTILVAVTFSIGLIVDDPKDASPVG